MAVDIGSSVSFDVGPALAALDKLGLAGTSLRDEQLKSNAAVSQSFAGVAQSAVAYSNELSRQQAEVRGATAALQSARDAMKQLGDQQKELTAAQGKTNSTTAEYQRLQKLLEQNGAEVQKVKQAVAENAQAVRDERAAVEAVRESRRQETNEAKLTAAAQKDLTAQVKAEGAAQKEAATAAGSTAGATTGLAGVLSKVGGVLGGIYVAGKLKQLGSEVLDVTTDFERMGAVLTTIFDGDDAKAQRVFAQLREFTLKNPFEVREVTEGYVKLRNVGINPSIQQLQQLADLAAASGKSFDTVTSGLLGATTGRFAQLKQFGITAQQQGDAVALTFRGVTTVVNKSQDAIADYVLGLGALSGVAGATARIMETTGGKITNLKDNFTELFASLGEGTAGPVNAFIKGLTLLTKGVNDYFKSDKQKIAEAAASPVQAYEDSIDVLLRAAVARAKKNGANANAAIAAVVSAQQDDLARQLVEAQNRVASLPDPKNDYAAYAAKYRDISGTGTDGAARARAKADAIEAKAYLQYVQAGQKALQDRAAAALKGGTDEAAILGRIQALRAKIDADTKARDQTANTKAGNAERIRLNALLQDENKLLDELLGKEKKVQKARQYSYESQLRALLAERATLTSLAAKAAEQQADDATARAKAVFAEGLRQVDVVQAKLVQRELDLRKAAAKVGGGAVAKLGGQADGVIDGVQQQQLNLLRAAAQQQLTKELARIGRERQALLLSLQQDSDQKELDVLEAAFQEQLRLYEKQAGVRLALETKYARDREALLKAQATRGAGQQQQLGSVQAAATAEVFGPGTGQSVYEAQFSERQQQLDADKTFAEKRLDILKDSKGKEADIERAALAGQLLRIRNQQKDLDQETTRYKFSIYKLILGENDNDKTRAALDKVASTVIDGLQQITAAEERAAADRVAVSNQVINELTGQLAAQIQLNAAGSASNIKGLQDQIAAEKQTRRDALDDQRKAAKEKVLLDTLTQASSIATAAAEVFAVFAPIPFVGVPLGIAAAGVLIAAFAASKIQAYTAAGNIGSGYYRGGYTGGTDEREERGVVHGKEFVHTAEKTTKYRTLFEALHTDKPATINWELPQYKALLPQAHVALLPDLELPDKLRTERAQSLQVQHEHSFAPMQRQFDRIHERLAAIEKSNGRMADRPDRVPLGGSKYIEIEENGSTHVKDLG